MQQKAIKVKERKPNFIYKFIAVLINVYIAPSGVKHKPPFSLP